MTSEARGVPSKRTSRYGLSSTMTRSCLSAMRMISRRRDTWKGDACRILKVRYYVDELDNAALILQAYYCLLKEVRPHAMVVEGYALQPGSVIGKGVEATQVGWQSAENNITAG
ncbi:MAG: hypothetical protein MZV63_35260 [Marinilabiliales bacterium]|nr:hypothetical protein [Marinilabiliales bacterium]